MAAAPPCQDADAGTQQLQSPEEDGSLLPPAGGWYACYTRPRAEKKVHLMLGERAVESYLPAVPRVHRWRDRRRTVIVPLFPSYVFARTDSLLTVLETPGVCGVVRFESRPALIPDSDIRNIERFVQALTGAGRVKARPVAFQQGERVRITGGPFAGVEGVVVRRRNHRRVMVGLAAIGAGFEVDVPATELVSIDGAGAPIG